ncbi:hypothetical protein GCM10011506_45350 [Marivirga lumbricoides]|uniref:ABC transporter permease n=1 Tax=Marivirga lumbricoides TaxID=1046115 RepID=A0ABQ1N664_9BACT|nr:hypothetical protein GCM10011506_45350 [Marivirga lumbricoides]
MRSIFLYEWNHLKHSSFKWISIILFLFAALYGLHNGKNLYEEQSAEIERIEAKNQQERVDNLASFSKDSDGGRLSQPYLAIWFSHIYHYKKPSPALVYSIGQAEQFGYYKRVNIRASPYDEDMTNEIANPERLQVGMLDFTFVVLFLLPIVLLILVYDIKSIEVERGYLPLIRIQVGSLFSWILGRTLFYYVLLILLIIALLIYGAVLTDVLISDSMAFWNMLFYSFLYLSFWTLLYLVILYFGKSVMGNTLSMISIWIVFVFIIPAAVHQYIGIRKPVNLMTGMIDVRDMKNDLYELEDSILRKQLFVLFPELKSSVTAKTDDQSFISKNLDYYAISNELMKNSLAPIKAESNEKNEMISSTYWFNPLTYFSNKLNRISETHYQDYEIYRNEIQLLVDKHIKRTILDTWNKVKVDQHQYEKYTIELSKIK